MSRALPDGGMTDDLLQESGSRPKRPCPPAYGPDDPPKKRKKHGAPAADTYEPFDPTGVTIGH